MQKVPIIWLLPVREESPLASESLYGLRLAAGLLQSCSFSVQKKITQRRWLVWRGASALRYLEIPLLPFLRAVLRRAVEAGRQPQPVRPGSLSQIRSSFISANPSGASLVYSKQIAEIPLEG